MVNKEKVIIFDFNSQYTLLISKLLRNQLNIYNEIHQPDITVLNNDVKAIILSGGPEWHDEDLLFVEELLSGKIPILGICYGAQLLAKTMGANIIEGEKSEYGQVNIKFTNAIGYDEVWMSHSDSITDLDDKRVILRTANGNIAGFKYPINNICHLGLLFHPEVKETPYGDSYFKSFLKSYIKPNWTSDDIIKEIKNDIGNQLNVSDKVLIACSGGVDSTVSASLIHDVLGNRMTGIFINNGLLRMSEEDEVREMFNSLNINIVYLNKSVEFYEALKGITDPKEKRKIVGNLFIKIFEEYAEGKGFTHLGQGTIYPDVIESKGGIKQHHNVGGLPDKMNLKLIEPIRYLFKNEVRDIGRRLGINDSFIKRHPFPGPGLSIRILGEVTEEKVKILGKADKIYINYLKEKGLYDKIWQASTILLNDKSVGVQGDKRTYSHVIVLRAVNSEDGMTASVSVLYMNYLTEISNRIINEVKEVNRVVYDITSKPPGTIEWL